MVQEPVICKKCEERTLISHYARFVMDDDGTIIWGGSKVKGPFCEACFLAITDLVYGKPQVLKDEHEYLRRTKDQ